MVRGSRVRMLVLLIAFSAGKLRQGFPEVTSGSERESPRVLVELEQLQREAAGGQRE